MRRIPVTYAKPGMINARSIYNSEGKVILATGTAINEFYINLLIELGIRSLYIRDEITGDLFIPDIVSEKTRVDTIKVIRQTFAQLQSARRINFLPIKTAVEKILDEVLAHSNTLVHLVDIRTKEDYLFAHSVNVCILSLMTGISLAYNTLQLKELGIGALLHDIGNTRIPNELLLKQASLTKLEFNLIQKHTDQGLDILGQYPEISPLSAQIAFQHHERNDGTGYPNGLNGNDIHNYARIVAITDVYDALLADRFYRPPFPPFDAMRKIIRGAYTLFDPRTVAAFIENIAMYPVGSVVKLNNGDVGIVVDVNKQSQHRPIIRILMNDQGEKISEDKELDLDKLSNLFIVEGFNEEFSYSILRDIKKGKPIKLKNNN